MNFISNFLRVWLGRREEAKHYDQVGGVTGAFYDLLKIGTNFASFNGLRGSKVIAHAAGLLSLWAEQQAAEFRHLKKKRHGGGGGVNGFVH